MKNYKKIIIIMLIIVFTLIISSIVFYKFIYDKKETFQGKILEINGNMIIVEATETDNSKFVGEYILEINNQTNLEALGKQTNINTIKSLFQHPIVEITFSGEISETSPAKINNITKLKVLSEENIEILVYLDENTTNEEQEMIKQKIQAIDGIISIKFKSKEDVKSEMMESSEVFNEVFNNLKDNPLRDEFIVVIKDYTKKEEIIHLIENIEKVDIVK